MLLVTEHATSPNCGAVAGRNIAGGLVQRWDGSAWVDVTTIGGEDDIAVDFSPPITTDKLRVFDVVSGPGNGNSVIYEWWVFPTPACAPP
jgi:hypothetical protein